LDNTKTALIPAKQKPNLKKSKHQNETSCDSSENNTILIDEQIDFWNEGTSISSQEEARNGTTIDYRNVEEHIIKDVLLLLCKIAEKSERLINNSNTNLAECWMHIRTKFDGGKVHNLCNRGSLLRWGIKGKFRTTMVS
jgi:hypothetical protein